MGRSIVAPLLLLLPLSLLGCNAGLVGVSVLGLGAGAVAVRQCPGYVAVTLRDELTGAELCGEPVRARAGDRERRLRTCAPGALPAGSWELRAERGGAPASVEVAEAPRCERWMYAVELSLPEPAVGAVAIGRR
jgi:hypothetical protein